MIEKRKELQSWFRSPVTRESEATGTWKTWHRDSLFSFRIFVSLFLSFADCFFPSCHFYIPLDKFFHFFPNDENVQSRLCFFVCFCCLFVREISPTTLYSSSNNLCESAELSHTLYKMLHTYFYMWLHIVSSICYNLIKSVVQ